MNIKIKDESGVALVVALLIMVLLTVLGTAAITTTTTDVKISSNFKDSTDAFYAAETGLETAREYLQSNFSATNGWSDFLTSGNQFIETGIYGTVTTGSLNLIPLGNTTFGVFILDDDGFAWVSDENGNYTTDSNKKVLVTSKGADGTATVILQEYIEFFQGYDSYGGKDLTTGNTNVSSGEATWG